MANKTCPYRTRCPEANSCYEKTSKEETWCHRAKAFWDEEHSEEQKDYWKNPVGYEKGGLTASLDED